MFPSPYGDLLFLIHECFYTGMYCFFSVPLRGLVVFNVFKVLWAVFPTCVSVPLRGLVVFNYGTTTIKTEDGKFPSPYGD